jgi:hypothetical protein
MVRFMCALATVMAVSTSSLSGQAQSPARNLIQEVSTEGCIRLWRPQPVDPTKAASDRQPGLATIYLLTPPGVNSSSATDNPTYLLTPSGTIDFSKHVGQRVAITGTAQTVPVPASVQEPVSASTMRSENRASTDGLPRLTVTTLKMVTANCP